MQSSSETSLETFVTSLGKKKISHVSSLFLNSVKFIELYIHAKLRWAKISTSYKKKTFQKVHLSYGSPKVVLSMHSLICVWVLTLWLIKSKTNNCMRVHPEKSILFISWIEYSMIILISSISFLERNRIPFGSKKRNENDQHDHIILNLKGSENVLSPN